MSKIWALVALAVLVLFVAGLAIVLAIPAEAAGHSKKGTVGSQISSPLGDCIQKCKNEKLQCETNYRKHYIEESTIRTLCGDKEQKCVLQCSKNKPM